MTSDKIHELTMFYLDKTKSHPSLTPAELFEAYTTTYNALKELGKANPSGGMKFIK